LTKPLSEEILDEVKVFNPSDAYLMGFEECAGKVFIPSSANLDAALRKLRGLRTRAKEEIEKKVLDSLKTKLEFEEPQPILDEILNSIFGHLAKEGMNEGHLLSLMDTSCEAIDATLARFSGKRVSPGVKLLTLYRLDGILGILEVIKKETKSRKLKAECRRVGSKAKEFVALFELEGFGKGEFENVERVIAKHGSKLGRESFYLQALRDGMDYHESPEELERKAISWIDEELPHCQDAGAALARYYECSASPTDIEAKIQARMKLEPKELVRTTQKIRQVIQKFVEEDIHGINPKYDTKVMETPSYLTGVIPSGAAQYYGTYTRSPFQIFFQTTDPSRNPVKTVSQLINLLAHEEYGHCVHHSNSAMGFVRKLSTLELLSATEFAGPVSEGLSLNRELEFLNASKGLEAKGRLTEAEKDYVTMLDKFGGLKLINMELEYWTRFWRIVRFLRVVGDVRLNTGKQDLIRFVDWAHDYTGVPRSTVYYQIFPAHEGIFPGYATSYAVVGQEIKEIQDGIKKGEDRKRFSTYLCSIGFPPRSIYTRELREFAKKLK
jgi:hypothetical protein